LHFSAYRLDLIPEWIAKHRGIDGTRGTNVWEDCHHPNFLWDMMILPQSKPWSSVYMIHQP
jgi:hypothetical protein